MMSSPQDEEENKETGADAQLRWTQEDNDKHHAVDDPGIKKEGEHTKCPDAIMTGASSSSSSSTSPSDKKSEEKGSRAAIAKCAELLKKMPHLSDQTCKWVRSWAIQEALDQHAALVKKYDMLATIGKNRCQVRQTQLSFAELVVEEVLQEGKKGGQDATTIARHLQDAVDELKVITRMFNIEVAMTKKRLQQADDELQNSRYEMRIMKQVIDQRSALPDSDAGGKIQAPFGSTPPHGHFFYCCNCKVGGHGQRFAEYLLKRPNWRTYPCQKWFEDNGNQFWCPLGRRTVDFTDESQFSRLAMYLKGRIWLEDKLKLLDICADLMPKTYVIKNQQWVGENQSPADAEDDQKELPWFVKQSDRNWGTSVHVKKSFSECMDVAEPDSTYAVQRHIERPLLYKGKKCHIKFYCLLIGHDENTWELWTYRDGYLSISPNLWSPSDLSKDTQVTIIRTVRIVGLWDDTYVKVYPKCQQSVLQAFSRAIWMKKVEARDRKQFEIMSADFFVDEDLNVYLLEFNTSPVLKDPEDAPEVHDEALVMGALSVVVPWEGGDVGRWDHVAVIPGEDPEGKYTAEVVTEGEDTKS